MRVYSELASRYSRPALADWPYTNDRVAFAHDCFRWRTGQGPTPYQDEILGALDLHDRVCVRGPHGIGKSMTDAVAILHFALSAELAQQDWKLPSTASSWHQLSFYLWPEVHKWARLLRWEKLGRKPFDRNELLKLRLRLGSGEAFAITSDNPASIEGAHADWLFYLFDEAKVIIPDVWDAVEGAFAGAGEDTGLVAKWLANSTPGEPLGRFYDIQARKPGYEDWHVIHVTLDDAINAGRISRKWADDRLRQWGAKSIQYRNRVLGEFAEQDRDTVIPLRWIELANERWLARHAEPKRQGDRWGDWLEGADGLPFLSSVGVDVARSGDDRTVIARRHGMVCRELLRYDKQTTTLTSNIVEPMVVLAGTWATVDTDGVGAGVTDQLREAGIEVVAFMAASKTSYRDRSNLLEFGNKRAAAWWNLREMLDPDEGDDVALPPDDELLGDLVAPKWREGQGGRIFIEDKAEIQRRLGRSPDAGDAVVMAFWGEHPPRVDMDALRSPPRKGITDDLMDVRF